LNHPYIALDDSLEASTEQDLFLSFHPESRRFAPESSKVIAVAPGIASDGSNAANLTHRDVLQHHNPYVWMKANTDSVIELSVHGNSQYEKIVLDRLMKNEERRQREEEEARRRRREIEDAQPFPELSDEELNEEIRQQLAQAQAARQEDEKIDDLGMAGDKLVETQYLIPDKGDLAQKRFSWTVNRLVTDDDDEEGF